jgi:hypothetical protein
MNKLTSRQVGKISHQAKSNTPVKPVLTGLAACSEEAKIAALDNDPGPIDPTDYHTLLGRIQVAKPNLPKLYQQAAAQPFFDKLQALGESGFQQILLQDPNKQGTAGLMLDIAQAILQDGEHFNEAQTDAFEEVVADLYDGFLSAQDRSGIKMPDRAILPPMVKWGNPDSGPYTWPIDATTSFDLQTAIVNMPPANARKGLVAWAALGHETCGHDILHADHGLQAEMAKNLKDALKGMPADLPNYWAERIDETSSDVMGILNTGAAAAIGLIAYFRGLSAAFGGNGKLRSDGPADDPHPTDLLRGYLGAATVRLLSFDQAGAWADAVEAETDKDLGTNNITVAGQVIRVADAKKSAQLVAETLVKKPTQVLHNHSLIDIQDWRNADEGIVSRIRPLLSTNAPISSGIMQGAFAAHVVSAAVVAALANDAAIAILFSRMIQLLKAMHDKSPTWGPLAVIHRSNISRDFAFTVHRQASLAAGLDPDEAALECIHIQTGSESLDPSQQLGKAGVKGGALATCVNGKLGTSFSGADFPPEMTLGDCLDKIRSA